MVLGNKIFEEFEEGAKWQGKHGLPDKYKSYQSFVEGDQWPAATDRTKNLPRPVFNLVEMVISRKRAGVTNQTFLMTFRPSTAAATEAATEAASLYTSLVKDVMDDMTYTKVERDLIDDAATFGTGIAHFYWDSNLNTTGGLMGEVINPLDIVVADMEEEDIQAQDYIIIRSSQLVSAVKELAKKNEVSVAELEMIESEDSDSKRINLYTKYYRGDDGSVYFDMTTKDTVLIKNRSLTPTEEENIEAAAGYKLKLYPVVAFRWKRKRKSFYGLGEAAGLIEVNKAYNFIKAMQVLSAQATGWPQKVVREGGLANEKLTNEPGAIIKERIPDSVRYLNPPPSTYVASSIATEMWEMQRTITGVTEVTAGEMVGSQMAASAIIALQNQAKTPIREIQKHYFVAVREIGRIFEEFFKTYYSLPVTVTKEDEGGEEREYEFVAADYANVDFKLSIDVGTGSEYSEALTMATLDKFYEKKEITFEQYIDLAPTTVVPFKEKLKTMIKTKEANSLETVEDMKPDTEARSVVDSLPAL